MQRLLRVTASVGCVMVLMVATAVAAGASETVQNHNTGHNGSPTNTCGTSATGGNSPVTPGNAAAAPGSTFNPSGNAGAHYAGNNGTASQTHSNSSAAVSQYDTACFRLSGH
jgi:hypothetical protein